jgi:pyruvate,orthophosphate dikinase
MVFGNLGPSSGSGVVFTRDPWSSHTGVELYGDFTRRSQGEDVVAGLVHPLPISEKQRLTRQRKDPVSMETAFPEVYARLREIAERLILREGFEHQEIEFTFESERAGDLYLLQTRPLRLLRQEKTVVFAHSEELVRSLLTRGTGVSGGAISGAIAFTLEDIRRLKEEDPKLPVILVRPDTVPEDIPLLLQADGLLTSRGGATSHAAITAKRLGKVCVVNCHDLAVAEGEHRARIGDRSFETGDMVSIDGVLGNVYAGRHEVLTTTAGRASIRGGIT